MTVRPWEDLVVSPRYVEAALEAEAPGAVEFEGGAGTCRAATLTDARGGGYTPAAGGGWLTARRYTKERGGGRRGFYVFLFPNGDGGDWRATIEGASALSDRAVPGSTALPPKPPGELTGTPRETIAVVVGLGLLLLWRVFK